MRREAYDRKIILVVLLKGGKKKYSNKKKGWIQKSELRLKLRESLLAKWYLWSVLILILFGSDKERMARDKECDDE